MYLSTSKESSIELVHVYTHMYYVLLTSQLRVVKNQELHDYYGKSTMETNNVIIIIHVLLITN